MKVFKKKVLIYKHLPGMGAKKKKPPITGQVWFLFLFKLWDRWTGSSARGLSQIWLDDTEKSRKFLKPAMSWRHARAYNLKMAIPSFFPQMIRIWGFFRRQFLRRIRSSFFSVAKSRNLVPGKIWVSFQSDWNEDSQGTHFTVGGGSSSALVH
jgi:hypothetical protein